MMEESNTEAPTTGKITTDQNPDWVELAEVFPATKPRGPLVHIKFGSDVGSGSVWLTPAQTVEFSKELGKAMMLLSGEVADDLEESADELEG